MHASGKPDVWLIVKCFTARRFPNPLTLGGGHCSCMTGNSSKETWRARQCLCRCVAWLCDAYFMVALWSDPCRGSWPWIHPESHFIWYSMLSISSHLYSIWPISHGPYLMIHNIWFTSSYPYHMIHIIWSISFHPHHLIHLIHVIWSISYDPHHLIHIVCDPYLIHIIWSIWCDPKRLIHTHRIHVIWSIIPYDP